MAGILKAERVALNFLQRLSGIATLTAAMSRRSRAPGPHCRYAQDHAGLRLLEKYAVRAGGGHNHRLHLGDGVLIKDNHLAALRATGIDLGDIVLARRNAPAGSPSKWRSLTSRKPVKHSRRAPISSCWTTWASRTWPRCEVNGRAGTVEASGGITLANVRQVAQTGVEIISVGALTHSYKSLDISLELET